MPVLNQLAATDFDGTTTFGDRVHIVHVYVVEPHPMGPDASPYGGHVSERVPYSTKSQPLTYDARVANATTLAPLITGSQLLLIDDLVPGPHTNPVWCTYGPAPNSAYLIGQDGVLVNVQTWVDVGRMETEIRNLIEGSSTR